MMASFGLGTIPAMMLAPSALHRMAPRLRNSVMRLAALLIIIMAIITIMRAQMIMSA
jgi:sulfite exporter TauE/SafE